MGKTKGLPYIYMLTDWKLSFEALKLKEQDPHYPHWRYAIDLFKEVAKEAAALYKIQWSVDVESHATVAVESLIIDIEEELRVGRVRVAPTHKS